MESVSQTLVLSHSNPSLCAIWRCAGEAARNDDSPGPCLKNAQLLTSKAARKRHRVVRSVHMIPCG